MKLSRIKLRKIREYLLKYAGLTSIMIALMCLGMLLYSIIYNGIGAFYNHYVSLPVSYTLVKELDEKDLVKVLDNILAKKLSKDNKNHLQKISIRDFISTQQSLKPKDILPNLSCENKKTCKGNLRLLASSKVDMILKGMIEKDSIERTFYTTVKDMEESGILVKGFNSFFFSNADSRYPELAGIKGAVVGSLYTVLLSIVFSIIVGVGASIYLSEFAPTNKLIYFLEVNINNLASVPSIVFGLLGLLVFQQTLGLPRATPLLASTVLSLMMLPSIIISTKLALKTVNKSLKDASYGLGATKLQMVMHIMLPSAMPGILTGLIISISRIIGETAPLLLIGMVAYINTVPSSIFSNALVFPVQILLWSNSPEIGYVEKASAAAMILLVFLLVLNLISIILRYKFEKKYFRI